MPTGGDVRPRHRRSLYDGPAENLAEIRRLAQARVTWVLEYAGEKTLVELLSMAYVQAIVDTAESTER